MEVAKEATRGVADKPRILNAGCAAHSSLPTEGWPHAPERVYRVEWRGGREMGGVGEGMRGQAPGLGRTEGICDPTHFQIARFPLFTPPLPFPLRIPTSIQQRCNRHSTAVTAWVIFWLMDALHIN